MNCSDIRPVPKQALDPRPIATLSAWKIAELDKALWYSLEIRH